VVLVELDQPAFVKKDGHMHYGFNVTFPMWSIVKLLRFSAWHQLHQAAMKLLGQDGTPLGQLKAFPAFANKHRLSFSFVDPEKRSAELYEWLAALVALPAAMAPTEAERRS